MNQTKHNKCSNLHNTEKFNVIIMLPYLLGLYINYLIHSINHFTCTVMYLSLCIDIIELLFVHVYHITFLVSVALLMDTGQCTCLLFVLNSSSRIKDILRYLKIYLLTCTFLSYLHNSYI